MCCCHLAHGEGSSDGGGEDVAREVVGPLDSADTAPSMQALLDLFAALGHECTQGGNSSSNMFCAAFSHRCKRTDVLGLAVRKTVYYAGSCLDFIDRCRLYHSNL